MKFYLIIFLMLGMCFGFVSQTKAEESVQTGSLIKGSLSSVYYYAKDGKRYVFPYEKVYKSWFADFSNVKKVSDDFLATLSIGGNVTYKPGVKMVKITTDPKTYAVAGGEVLRWVKTEAVAVSLYGVDWNKKIDDVPDAFFINYTIGDSIDKSEDFVPSNETVKYANIDDDKGATPKKTTKTPKSKYVWARQTINQDSYFHKNLILSKFSSGFLASWYDDRNGQNEVYYQKTASTTKSKGGAIRVSNNVSSSNNGKGLSDGSNLYFLWEDSSAIRRTIYLQKWDLVGNKFSERVFASTTFATSKYPDFDWSQSLGEYGVVWWDSRKSESGLTGDLFFNRITKTGLKIGNETRVTPASSAEFTPKVVSAGENFGVIWQDGNKKIKFALIDKNSALSGSIKEVYTASQSTMPRIAWSGQNFGVVWADKNGDNQDIYFMLLDKNGNNIGTKLSLTSGVGDAVEPDILWDSSKFYISYTKHKPKVSTASTASGIYVTKVNINRTISEADKNVSNTTTTKSHSSSLAKNGTTIGIAWLEDSGGVDKILGAVEKEVINN